MKKIAENKVNAFIIGAQKAGTTSLYYWLGQHPQIEAPSELKDYHFFSKENLYRKGHSHLNQFYNKSKVGIRLHSAVNYLYFHEKCAKRLHEYNPNAKLIICLRNPVNRALSAYKYFVRSLEEERSFEDAMYREINDELSDNELSDFTYLGHGLYLEQINSYLQYFNREQIQIILFEELTDKRRQKEVMEDILKFLEVETSVEFDFTHMNMSGKPKNLFLIRFIRDRKLSRLIKYLIPFSFRKKIGRMLIEKNISEEKIKISINKKTKERLNEFYEKPIKRLGSFMDKDLSAFWNDYSDRR